MSGLHLFVLVTETGLEKFLKCIVGLMITAKMEENLLIRRNRLAKMNLPIKGRAILPPLNQMHDDGGDSEAK